MATLQASNVICSSYTSLSSSCRRGTIRDAINVPKLRRITLPTLSTRGLVEELELRSGYPKTSTTTHIIEKSYSNSPRKTKNSPRGEPDVADPMAIRQLYAIMEAVADRVEMHKNIGEQRSNWNSLLLTSINAITLGAATMAGIAATTASIGAIPVALKLSSTLMYLAATGMLLIMNKIQPSQLAEEQRNATRLFKQLQRLIQTAISTGTPTIGDVKELMEKVLALDKAFPLPLLGGAMLDKFPSTVEPAVWWPQQRRRQAKKAGGKIDGNGWDERLEEEMREIIGVMERKDKEDYLRLGEKAVRLNKALAIAGPLLTGLAAVGSAFVGSPSHSGWAAVVGVAAGALASVVNTFEHGAQVGMVFEMYRGNAGFFRLMEETIESNLGEREVERRENGELLEMKVALQLGRSLSGLRDLATSSRKGHTTEEFASKLF